ncbi:MAG: class I SAM-dependent methyltransferase [Pseudomonadota bacterium]|nr:class I SAM-dependent methyltransferase [Pseudomonadota bacterium]
MFPKLLGSYESELHPQIDRLLTRDYSDIVDVGCAEGYYAVGFGLKYPQANLYAFDISEKAQSLCREMALANGIDASRLHVDGAIDRRYLHALTFQDRALVVSDCEGFEKELFSPETPQHMARHDFLIETHDLIDIHISGYLRDIFATTHDLFVVSSVDDIHKAQRYQYAELDKFSLPERKILLGEGRSAAMEWLVCLSRSDHGA